jgi:predicted esterase
VRLRCRPLPLHSRNRAIAGESYFGFRIAGLEGLRIAACGEERAVIVLLHGYSMDPMELAPLAEAMRLPATIYLPRGILAAESQGRAWWPVDLIRRAQQMARGARDLFDEDPPGREELRQLFCGLVAELTVRHAGQPLILAGFSQGGMLAGDLVFRGGLRPQALALMSSCRIAAAEWQRSRMDALHRLPVLVAHGRHDDDLSVKAGERLRDLFSENGALVSWLPFDGGHGMPLVVWRALRRFAAGVPGPEKQPVSGKPE